MLLHRRAIAHIRTGPHFALLDLFYPVGQMIGQLLFGSACQQAALLFIEHLGECLIGLRLCVEVALLGLAILQDDLSYPFFAAFAVRAAEDGTGAASARLAFARAALPGLFLFVSHDISLSG